MKTLHWWHSVSPAVHVCAECAVIRVRWQRGRKGMRVAKVAYGSIVYGEDLKMKWKWVSKVPECVEQVGEKVYVK